MIKILSLFIFSITMAYAACPACVCVEQISITKSIEYQTEIEKIVNQKINPKIDTISAKANKAKELQREINNSLEQLKNLEIQVFIINKQKNFHLSNIANEVSVGSDVSTIESKAISERIKNKLELMSSYQNKSIEEDISSYLKK